MIITEFYKTREDGTNLYRTYSDLNMMIQQIETGKEYSEAIDVEGTYTYIETENPIESEEATSEDYTNALHSLGVVV